MGYIGNGRLEIMHTVAWYVTAQAWRLANLP